MAVINYDDCPIAYIEYLGDKLQIEFIIENGHIFVEGE